MNTVDLGFFFVLATGIATGIAWERREALVDWLASRLDSDVPVPRELPRSRPSVRLVRGPYDYERDERA